MSEDTIQLRVDGHVATLTINRPEKSNALNHAMWRTLDERMRELAAEAADTRVVVLRGAGEKAFSAGADLSEFQQGPDADSGDYARQFEQSLRRFTDHPVPVLAMMQGAALGAGCQLALACDLRVASDRAPVGIPAARLGLALPPEAIERLVQVVGIQRAREIMYFGRRYVAEDARAIGLVDMVVPHDALEETVYALAEEIARNAPLAVQAAKLALNGAVRHGAWERDRDAAALAPLDALAERCFRSADLQEGLAAFFGKRTPEFTGQ